MQYCCVFYLGRLFSIIIKNAGYYETLFRPCALAFSVTTYFKMKIYLAHDKLQNVCNEKPFFRIIQS